MVNTDMFSLATLMYARLRRVSGRVIDAMYLSQNENYAQYVIDLALQTQDGELRRLAFALQDLLPEQNPSVKTEITMHKVNQSFNMTASSEPTEEDILRNQVAHRYIGSLR